MNITLTIVHTVAPEVLALLNKVYANQPTGPAIQETVKALTMVKEDKPKKVVETKPIDTTQVSTPAAATTNNDAATGAVPTDTNGVTLIDVRAKAVPLSKAGHKDSIKKLIASHGAPCLDELKPEFFGIFLAELDKLK